MQEEIISWLITRQDKEYKYFIQGLTPDLSKDLIGVRVPDLRALAKDISKGDPGPKEAFLADLPHPYHELDLVHGYLIELEKDYERALAYLEDFLPHITTWALTDSFTIKTMRDHPQEALARIKVWLASPHAYTVRFGLVSLIKHFTKDNFQPEINDLVASLDREEYYIKMAQAWYFQQALADQREASLPYFEKVLQGDVKKMAIQKALDSRQISQADKAYLHQIRKNIIK